MGYNKIVLVDKKNKIILRSDLGQEFKLQTEMAALKDGRILIASEKDVFAFDPKTSKTKKLATQLGGIDSICGLKSGGFVISGDIQLQYSSVPCLAVYDKNGKNVWEIKQNGYSGAESEFLSPGNVGQMPDGRIVLLDQSKSSLMFFSEKGKYLSSIRLRGTDKMEMIYPTELTVSDKGVIAVGDTLDLRLVSNGKLSGTLKLKDETGKVTTGWNGILSYSDGYLAEISGEIRRFDSSGKLVGSVGSIDKPNSLRSIDAVSIFPSDGSFVVADRNRTLPIFFLTRANGRRRFPAIFIDMMGSRS